MHPVASEKEISFLQGIFPPSGQKGKTHYEWQMAKAGTSWKAQMKSDMDNAIREAHSYEDFISRMQTKGYEVKGETFGDNVPFA